MKYKLLLTGKNRASIEDFFNQLSLEFTLMTTSLRYEDMANHLDVCNPDMMVICLNGESEEISSSFLELKRKLAKNEIQLAVIGEAADIEKFQKKTLNMADLTMTKPINALDIKSSINNHMRSVENEKQNMANQLKAQQEAEALMHKNERKHILVVDDEPIMLKMIQEQLSDKYDVATAISGKIAYKFLEKKGTDLILLDYEMPVENGPMVMAKIRESSQYDNIPIVFLTGVTDKEKIKEVLALKPAGYILKPLDREKLRSTIAKVLG